MAISQLPPVDPNNLTALDAFFPPPVNPGDLGRGPLVMGVTWTFSALAIIMVLVRFALRIGVTKRLHIEDWLMLVAVILNTASVSCLTVAFRYGFGKHDKALLFSELVNIAKWMWMQFTPGIVCSMVARTSIAILLCRIFGVHKRLKWFLIIITVLQVLASVILTLTTWNQVRPVQAMWNPLIPARRISPNVVARMGNVVGGLFALGDLAYVLGPVLVVVKLNMPMHRKVTVAVLLALSLFTMGCSIAKGVAAESGTQAAEDKQYKASIALMWAILEQAFVIMMGCAPPLSSITKVKMISRMASSIQSLFSSFDSGTDSKGSAKRSGDGYYEMEVPGKPLVSGAQSFDGTATPSIETGKVRKTEQYHVKYSNNMEQV